MTSGDDRPGSGDETRDALRPSEPAADAVKEIFADACDLPADQRDSFLRLRCGDDADLRHSVDELLKAHDEAGNFFAGPTHASRPDGEAVAAVGQRIGRYKLLQLIGEGGFGTVYMAEQEEPVRRRVALKIIKLGMDTKSVIARFEAERQALAMMDHPNIARVFDAGATDAGRPYFVMELVRGVPITDYCDTNNLPVRERLDLFVQVCQAVQHAHQKGIIHRDIKPNNVMVTMADGRPTPKVIDFGIAKATDQRLTEKTLFTEFHQMIGTPQYMSPEQAEMAGIDIDTRSDVYSLGVLLYELLVGSTPFDPKELRGKAYGEMQRMIREVEPPLPSTRLSTLISTLPSVAAHRGIEPKRLGQLVRGELDWIAMKSLEKDRSRRYETANGLASDVRRYLDDEAVEACPPSRMYRLKKFARRNKAAIAMGVLIAVILVLATATSSWEAVRATCAKTAAIAEKLRADQAAATAASVAGYLQQMLASTGRTDGKGNSYTARQMLDDFANTLGNKLDNQPNVEASLQETSGRIYRNLGDGDHAVQHFTRLLALRRQVYGDQHEKYADALVDYADGLRVQANQAPAEDATRHQLEASLREALAIYRNRGVSGGQVLDALYGLTTNLTALGKFSEREAIAEQGMTIARQLPDDPRIADWYLELGRCEMIRGDYAAAEALYRQALEVSRRLRGPEDLQTAWAWSYLGGAALTGQHKYAEALASRREALEIFRRQCPANHRNIGNALWGISQNINEARCFAALAEMFPTTDKLCEVEALYRPSLATTPVLTSLNPALEAAQDLGILAGVYLDLAQEYLAAGTSREAQAARQKANDLVGRLPSDCRGEPALLMAAYPELIVAAMRLDRSDDANEMRGQLAGLDPKDAIGDPLNHTAWSLVVPAHPTNDQTALAVEFAEKAVTISPQDGNFWNTLGVARYRAGEWRKAIEALQKARELQKYRTLSEDSFFLAMACWQLGQTDQALAWYDRGQAWMQKNLPKNHELLGFRDEAQLLIHPTARPGSLERSPTTVPLLKAAEPVAK